MAKTAEHVRSALLRQVKSDLAWFPGRFATTWRVAALCSLMAFIAMLYGIPEAAISCYLILFVMKPDAVESMVMAIAVSLLVSIVVGLIILILPYVLESAPLRMAVLIVSSFAFLWLGSASKLGPIGSIIALVIAFIMSVLGNAPDGELATRAILYAWLMAVAPMMLLIAFNLLMGRAPWKLLYATLSDRMETAAEALRHPDDANMKKVSGLLREGQSEHQQRILLIRIFHLLPAAEVARLEAAINSSYHLLLALSAQDDWIPDAMRHELAAWCEEAAQAIVHRRPVEAPAVAAASGSCEICKAIVAFTQPEYARAPDSPKRAFFVEDAFTSPVHQYFALKTTAASVICYFIYTALDWQDIHTAMITCYVAALGTTGETVHKLTLRIVGCLIGAFIGVLSLVYIVPELTDIGQLMVLIFGVILLAAWVSSGNERIAYAGIQIGLAFLLTVLHGFSPSTDLDVALDRILGILLGNIVVYLIFTRLWPISVADSVRERIRKVLNDSTTLASLPASAHIAALREAAAIEEEVSSARERLELLPFEPLSFRPSPDDTVKLKSILTEIEIICPLLFVPDNRSLENIERLRGISTGAANDITITDSHYRQVSPPEIKIHQSITRLEELLR